MILSKLSFIIFSGKATLGLSSSQSVSFRHGTNVEFNSPGFSPGNPTSPSLATDQIPPMDSYNLETLNNKSRDFSNPMYDAVQSGDSHMGKLQTSLVILNNFVSHFSTNLRRTDGFKRARASVSCNCTQ